MTSIALFPCSFTDGARIIGELSYTFRKPVYNDQVILAEVCEGLGAKPAQVREKLFSRAGNASSLSREKDVLIGQIHSCLNRRLKREEDWMYYGFFSTLLEQHEPVWKILIKAEKQCRVERGMHQENLTRDQAQQIIAENDRKAAVWTRYLYGSEPYSPELFDIVITYEHQDLMDVVAYLFMLYQECTSRGTISLSA